MLIARDQNQEQSEEEATQEHNDISKNEHHQQYKKNTDSRRLVRKLSLLSIHDMYALDIQITKKKHPALTRSKTIDFGRNWNCLYAKSNDVINKEGKKTSEQEMTPPRCPKRKRESSSSSSSEEDDTSHESKFKSSKMVKKNN